MRLFVVGFLLVGVASAAPAALAQDASVAGEGREAAAERFREAEAAFEDHDYERALELFREAHELAPHDAVRFNIAVCLERLARYREAKREYELAADSPDLDAAARDRARAQIERVLERIASLEVVGNPAGAVVRVDGARRCTTPCTIPVDPRPHHVTVEKDGRRASRDIDPARGQELTWRFELAEAGGEPASPPADEPARRPGWLSWVGSGVALVGAAGIAGFGLRARTLHDRYTEEPTSDRRDEGILMRNLTNASIGVAAAGAILLLLDVAFLRTGGERRTDVSSASGGTPSLRWSF